MRSSDGISCVGMNIHQFLEEMEKRDPAVSISQDAVMVCR